MKVSSVMKSFAMSRTRNMLICFIVCLTGWWSAVVSRKFVTGFHFIISFHFLSRMPKRDSRFDVVNATQPFTWDFVLLPLTISYSGRYPLHCSRISADPHFPSTWQRRSTFCLTRKTPPKPAAFVTGGRLKLTARYQHQRLTYMAC